jgi:hypothetical protein
VLSGLAVLAVALRGDLSGEWPLPLAILFGATLLALGLRLRQLAFEIAS